MRAVMKDCCAKKCLTSISLNKSNGNFSEAFELIKCCRLDLMGLNDEERTDEIRKKMNGLILFNYYFIFILLYYYYLLF
jgi:hypothetical protein